MTSEERIMRVDRIYKILATKDLTVQKHTELCTELWNHQFYINRQPLCRKYVRIMSVEKVNNFKYSRV